MLPSDNHVHTRWSWDTAAASTMERSCARAVEHGIPAVAFTEHIDFTEWTDGGHIRHPSFQGVRRDKKAREVVREVAIAVPGGGKAAGSNRRRSK